MGLAATFELMAKIIKESLKNPLAESTLSKPAEEKKEEKKNPQ